MLPELFFQFLDWNVKIIQ